MSTDEKRRWPSAKARDYFSVQSADGHGDKDKSLCDLCHKPVKAPGGKSRPSIVRNILMYMSKLVIKQEAQLMLTTGSTRLAVSRGQQTWYHSTCNI